MDSILVLTTVLIGTTIEIILVGDSRSFLATSTESVPSSTKITFIHSDSLMYTSELIFSSAFSISSISYDFISKSSFPLPFNITSMILMLYFVFNYNT
jgi:hypothetical protein